MNLHFFFQGKLSREESASAFLATLLEQRADFRSFFFGTIGVEEPQSPCQVKTEYRDIDIRVGDGSENGKVRFTLLEPDRVE